MQRGWLVAENLVSEAIQELHEGEVFRWRANEWTSEPGSNCAPLSPTGEGVGKTLPLQTVSVFSEDNPPLREDVTEINRNFLEVSSDLKSNKWIAILPGLVGMPLTFVGAGISHATRA